MAVIIEVVKVQWPLKSNEKDPKVLVYNQDQSFMKTYPKRVWSLARRGIEHKAFFQIKRDDTGFEVLRRVEDPGW